MDIKKFRCYAFFMKEAEGPPVFWKNFPELASLCWNRHTPQIAESLALQLYETNWPFVDQKKMPTHEKEFVRHLSKTFASHLHV